MIEKYPDDSKKLYGLHKKRYLGDDVVVNGVFSADTDWNKGVDCTIAGGLCTWGGTQGAASNTRTTVAPLPTMGNLVRVIFTVSGRTVGTMTISAGSGSLPNGTVRSTNETFVEDLVVLGNTHIYIQADATFDGSVDNIIVRPINPNKLKLY